MQGLFTILLCWLAGNLLSHLTGHYISGNLIGMVLLFLVLQLGWVNPEKVRPAAQWLLGVMALFFVPFGVGLMISYEHLMQNLTAVVVATLISTVVVIGVVGWIFQRLNCKKSEQS